MVKHMAKHMATLVALAVLTTAGAACAGVTFELLDTPNDADWANFSLSRDGRNMGCVLGGSVYWWTEGDGYRFLDTGTSDLGGVGMSANGNALVAARSIDGGSVAAIWYMDGRSIDLSPLSWECGEGHRVDGGFDLNADGTIAVGQADDCDGDAGFLWSMTDGIHNLGLPGGADSRAAAVSADGGTVVGFCEHPREEYRQPALWSGDGQPHLFLGADRPGEAHNISPDGCIVVGQAQLGGLRPQAFYWTHETRTINLGSLSGRATDPSSAKAVSDDGKVVGWSGDDLWGEQEAFIWTTEHGMLSLRQVLRDQGVDLPPSLVLTGALDISGDGNTIVGVGRDRDWNPRYWLIHLDGALEVSPLAGSSAAKPVPPPSVHPDSLDTHQADFLHPFPFGKRRYGPFQ